MFSFNLVYITLNLLMLFIFCKVGKDVSKKKSYWSFVIPIIIVFTFVMGARYGRGNDYFHYAINYYVYHYESTQWGFVFIMDILRFFNIDKYYIFFFYSLIEITGLCCFLKYYKKYAVYIFPVSLIAVLYFDEYLIRQALSFTFLFLYLIEIFHIKIIDGWKRVSFFKKNLYSLLRAGLFFLLMISIHFANAYIAIIITALYFFVRIPIPYSISIPAAFFCVYFFSTWFDFNWLNDLLTLTADTNERAAVYVENSDKWFSHEGMEDKYVRNSFVAIFELIGVSSLFFLGHRTIKEMKLSQDLITLYNTSVIGILIVFAFRELEILNRLGYALSIFWFVPLSFVLYYRNKMPSNIKKMKIIYVCLIWYLYDYLKYLFMRGEMTLFIWDI